MEEEITHTRRQATRSTSGHASELQESDAATPRVIFIVGWGRSGSTVLGNVLGELRGCVHVGELHDLWSAYADRFECGCGLPLPLCRFWAQVASADRVVGGALLSASEVARTKQRHLRVRYVPRMLLGSPPAQAFRSPIDGYSDLACRLFHSVATAANAGIVVDSTKSPAAAALLLRMPLKVSFIHLVRDPRATGFSWRRHKLSDLSGTRQQTRIGYAHNAASWLYWNAVAELIRRHVDPADWLRIRYEDFATSPEAVLKKIVEKFGLPTTGWPLHGQVLQMGTHHTVEGNPSRFKTGPQQVVIDEQWSKRMSRLARVLSVAITAPLFVAYGYHRNSPLKSDDKMAD